jgi:outer membrane protein TolC
MLPSVMVSAGYSNRSNFSGGESRPMFGPAGSRPRDAGPANGAFSTSQERERALAAAEFGWNVLDFGVSYYRARQRADEFLISEERRRRVVQTIIHDVRSAYWRALGAQRLAGDADRVMKRAEEAISKSREAEASGAVPVNTALAYQRSLLDAVAQRQVLGARRGPDRIGLHEAKADEGPRERPRREQAARDRVTPQPAERRRHGGQPL